MKISSNANIYFFICSKKQIKKSINAIHIIAGLETVLNIFNKKCYNVYPKQDNMFHLTY